MLSFPDRSAVMSNTIYGLSEDELNELDIFLLYELESDEGMTIDILDGFLHAIAIGPVSVPPTRWLPKVWGTETAAPPADSIERLNHITSLVIRRFNGIIAGFECEPPEMAPIWMMTKYRGREYIDAEAWAYGFTEGMELCLHDWKPMLATVEGQAWFRPIGLLANADFSPDQDELTKTPARRAKIAKDIPQAVMAMHNYWLPLRFAAYEQQLARAMLPKVGRNDSCPCGSGKKFKKCCGAPADLH